MKATIYTIAKKSKVRSEHIVSRDDFKLRVQGKLTIQDVVDNVNLSLYCLDDEKRVALFVETPRHVELLNFRLFHQAQFEFAQRVVEVRYQDLAKIVQRLEVKLEHLIFFHAMQSCAVRQMQQLWCKSENVIYLKQPSVFSQVQQLSTRGGLRNREINHLLETCTTLLCARAMQREGKQAVVIEFHEANIQLAQRLIQQFPDAKNLFLYRDAQTYTQERVQAFCASAWRTFLFKASNAVVLKKWYSLWLRRRRKTARRKYHLLEEYPSDTYENQGMLGFFVVNWLSGMDRYLRLYRRQLDLLPIQNIEFLLKPEQTFCEVIQYCGFDDSLKLHPNNSNAPTVALQDESMQEEKLSLSEAELAVIEQFIVSHPQLDSPRYILPTL